MESISSKTMYAIEEHAHKMGMLRVFMMENAGSCIARYIIESFNELNKKSIIAIAGTGNNGGDTFVAARHLARYTKPIVILLGNKDDIKTDESRINYEILERMNKSIKLLNTKEINDGIKEIVLKADIIIDGIFGTGIKGKIREPHASMIDLINSSKAYKISVDIPSGLDPDEGIAMDKCVIPDIIITFHKAKDGLLKDKIFKDKVRVCHIGIPPEADEL